MSFFGGRDKNSDSDSEDVWKALQEKEKAWFKDGYKKGFEAAVFKPYYANFSGGNSPRGEIWKEAKQRIYSIMRPQDPNNYVDSERIGYVLGLMSGLIERYPYAAYLWNSDSNEEQDTIAFVKEVRTMLKNNPVALEKIRKKLLSIDRTKAINVLYEVIPKPPDIFTPDRVKRDDENLARLVHLFS